MKKLLVITTVFIFFMGVAMAVPDIMNYQGRVFSPAGSSTPVPDSTGNTVSIRIYKNQFDPVGSWLWQQTIYNVETKNGYFSIQFGGFGSVLDFKDDYWLGIEFNNDGEMTPRQKLVSAPYAGRAQFVNLVDSNTKIIGPVSLTSSSEIEAGLSVTSTGNTAILGVFTGNVSYTAGIAGYNYSPLSFTVGVYGFGMNGMGVYGGTSGTAQIAVQGEAYNGIGIYGRGVTGVAASSSSGGVALYVDGNGSMQPFVIDGGGSALFRGPGLTIDSGAYPAALWVSFTAGAWPAAIISATNGQAMQIYGSAGGLGKPIVEIKGNTTFGTVTGLSVMGGGNSGGYGISATASGGTGVLGVGVTGVAAVANDYMADLAFYANGKSYMYGSTTIVASGGADPNGAALNIYNNSGTGYGIYTNNPPGIAFYGTGSVGARGFGTDVGVEGIGTSGIGFGIHTYNGSADGLQNGASLYISGKIKVDSGGVINSPVGVVSFSPGDGPNPVTNVTNNLCYNQFHVFITPSANARVTAGNRPISWWVEKISGGFNLHLETDGQPLDNIANFSYLIINE